MLGRAVKVLAAFVAAVLLITLAVANRHGARLVLDPFNPNNPLVSIVLPFYAFLLATLILGVGLGGVATWMSQSKWRRNARTRAQEAVRWKAEAERLTRERDTGAAARKQLAVTGP